MGACVGSMFGSMLITACLGCCSCKKGRPGTIISARIGSLVILTFGAILALIGSYLGFKIFHNKPFGPDIGKCEGDLEACANKLLAIRLGTGVILFFVLMLILSLPILCCGAGSTCLMLQNGCWIIKIFIFLAICVGTYFLPPNSTQALYYIVLIGSAIFLILQIAILIEFFASWNDNWLAKEWNKGLMAVFVIGCIGYLILVALTFTFFHTCTKDIVFTVVTIVLAIILVIITGCIPSASFFTTVLVILYCIYLNFTTLISNNQQNCIGIDPKQSEMRVNFINAPIQSVHDFIKQQYNIALPNDDSEGGTTVIVIISAIFTYIALIYSVFSSSGDLTENEEQECCNSNDDGNKRKSEPIEVIRGGNWDSSSANQTSPLTGQSKNNNSDESSASKYGCQYIRLYLLYILAAMHLTTIVVGWSLNTYKSFEKSFIPISMWSKAASNWVCFLLYLWVLLAPIIGPYIFPSRDWGNTS
ncbi:MAG: putative serine incorporator [Streblomastix strix]|uniref:Putative serine incorporator n=1 Tax=Streblomastix strix TaxID=222440 RepID=A0A5J4XAS8_9EUKA|nr:MAG: putative serine incorporator [Streblomastix strix]